jgi:predicted nucleotidyltransferase
VWQRAGVSPSTSDSANGESVEAVLDLPALLTADQRRLVDEVVARNDARHRDGLLGLVLSGSAARGMATARSDLDLFIILDDDAASRRLIERSASVDAVPMSLADLETVSAFGTPGWWFRWSFAWAAVLLDRTGGRIASAAVRQATLTHDETDAVLLDHGRLDGWLNHAYRALKADRDGRPLERRLDAAESVPWLLDVVFALSGRVRPYNKYLPWEAHEHPLPDWPADVLLPLVRRLLDGEAAAVREAFAQIETSCGRYDIARGHELTRAVMDGWGKDLQLLHA